MAFFSVPFFHVLNGSIIFIVLVLF
jgi:hypothetical protein